MTLVSPPIHRYTSKDFPHWKKGDRVVSTVACFPDKLVPGHVGTIHADYVQTSRMGIFSRVWVRWDYNGLLDGMLPWELVYLDKEPDP